MLSKDEITARSLRLSGRAPNPYTGTLNDPFQEAQSNYSGPEWQQFFGSLQKKQEDAQDAGKSFRVGWSGFGNAVDEGGGAVARGRGPSLAAMSASDLELNPLEQQAQKNTALQQQANAIAEQAKAERNAQDDRNDAKTEHDNAAMAKSYQDFVLSSAFVPPSPITRTPGVTPPVGPASPTTYTARPTGAPMSNDAILQSVPGHMRPAMMQVLQEMTLKKQAADLAAREQTVKEGQLAESVRKDKATEAQNAPFAAPMAADGTPITGQALLQSLPPAKQKLVQAVLDGRQAIPSGTALKDPYWKGLIDTANLVDPNFDTVNFNSRNKTRQDFTSGKSSTDIKAINTVIGHLHDLATTGSQLGNTGLDWANSIYNKLTPGGTDRGVTVNNFETLKEGVANELMKVWRGGGVGSEKEIEDWKSTISAAKSPQELKGAFKTIGGMLESKLGAMDSVYKTGMGTQAVTAITPESRARLDALQGLGAEPAASPRRGNPFRK